jgi:hypothetical protein
VGTVVGQTVVFYNVDFGRDTYCRTIVLHRYLSNWGQLLYS